MRDTVSHYNATPGKFIHKYVSGLIGTCLLFAVTTSTHARDVSMVTTEWAPFYGSELDNGGVVTELVITALNRTGHNVSLKYMPWPRAMKLVKEGKRDMVMGAYHSEERAKNYLYSDSFYDIDVGFVASRDIGFEHYNSLNDLIDFTIGINRGWVYTEEFDNADYLKKEVSKNPVISAKKLRSGRIDLVAAAFGVFRYELKKIDGEDFEDYIYLKPLLDKKGLYVIASKVISDGDELVADFNRGIEQLRVDGTYDAIIQKHGVY